MNFKRRMAERLIQISYWMTDRLAGFNLEVLQWEMEQLSGVIDVHTIHVWRTHYRSNVLSAHIVIEDLKYVEAIKISLKAMLSNCYDIYQTTLEFETPNNQEIDSGEEQTLPRISQLDFLPVKSVQ